MQSWSPALARPIWRYPGQTLLSTLAPYVPVTPVRLLRQKTAPSHRSKNRKTQNTRSATRQKVNQFETHRKSSEGIPGINFFEQDAQEPGAPRRPVSSPDEDVAEYEKEVNSAIEKLEEDIRNNKLDLKPPDGMAGKIFSEEEIEQVQETLARRASSYTEMPHRIKIEAGMSKPGKMFVIKLNEALDAASINLSHNETRISLWRWYERSKIYVPGILQKMPDTAWELLWTTQSEEKASNENRAAHLKTLGQDMAKAGRILTREQHLAWLEGLFLEGQSERAIQEWEKEMKEEHGAHSEYLELGIRMYARSRNVKRADDLLDTFFKFHPSGNPRILLPLISTHIGLRTDEGYKKAWSLYTELRDRLSSDMTMEDYDQVSLQFMHAKQTQCGLAVFRDMMLEGSAKPSGNLYGTIMNRIGSFMRTSKDAQEVNSVGLNSLSHLPRRWQNKFFYASWMKKLIGMGEYDAAAQVIQLMYERGSRPDAKHCNGLVNALLSSGNARNQKRAEAMGWKMVQVRLDFVHRRRKQAMAESDAPSKSVFDNDEGAEIPADYTESVPGASIETFSILAQYYLRREKFDHVRHLRNLLVDAEIAMNSYIMNHLLFAERRNRTYQHAWSRFEVMSRTVEPDMDTFCFLWDCMKAHTDPSRDTEKRDFPLPRELFARMQRWLARSKGQLLRDALGDLQVGTYNDIIRCFCLSRDLEGSLVAVKALKETFEIYPDPTTIRMLTMQIARLSFFKPKNQAGAFKIRKSKYMKENMTRASGMLHALTQYRHHQLDENGVRFEDLDRSTQQEESHRTVMQFLYLVMMERHTEGFDGVKAIRNTAKEMEVEPFDIEEAISLPV